jgi:hypothetical protein
VLPCPTFTRGVGRLLTEGSRGVEIATAITSAPPMDVAAAVECRDNIFTLLARRLPTTYRKSLLKSPQRASLSPSHPAGIEPYGYLPNERVGGPARQPEGRQAKVRRLSLDGAQDAFLPLSGGAVSGSPAGEALPSWPSQRTRVARKRTTFYSYRPLALPCTGYTDRP